MLEDLKSVKSNLNLIYIMMDLEKAVINAAKIFFPDVSINDCFFHLSQCRYVMALCTRMWTLKKKYHDTKFCFTCTYVISFSFRTKNKGYKIF